MEYLQKSIVLSAFFPGSINSLDKFLKAIKLVKKYNLSLIEFYYEGIRKDMIKETIEKGMLKTVYLGAIASKREGLNLSSLNEVLRKRTVEKMKRCIDDSYFYGSTSLLINNGKRPGIKEKESDAYNCLRKSIIELLEYAKEVKKDYILNISLEPGNTNIDAYELIGNTNLAIKLVRDIKKEHDNFNLILDISHLRQLNEDPMNSIKSAFNYCNHIHLANCIIKDKKSNLYGDKHPEFGVENGEIDSKEVINIYKKIRKLYEGFQLMISLEIICREEDETSYSKKLLQKFNWFFNDCNNNHNKTE